jgi:uncharacterized membrane protein YfcA
VLVVPALVFGLGVGLHEAIGATLLSFRPSGLVALAISLRRGTLDRAMCAALWAGALPGALAGALALPFLPQRALLWLLVTILVASSLHSLARRPKVAGAKPALGASTLASIGAGVGAVSAITGTGGPISLMPILTWRQVAPLTAIAMCQAITVPISVFASIGNALTGVIDLRVAAILALSKTVGIFVGVRLAHVLPVAWLRRAVALMMLISGIVIALRLLLP